MLLGPRKRFLVVLFVVDAFFHTAQDLDLVDGFDAHSEVVFHKGLVHNRAADAHGDRADLKVGLAAHCGSRNGCATESEKLFGNVIGNLADVGNVLHLVTVYSERGETFLGVGGKD